MLWDEICCFASRLTVAGGSLHETTGRKNMLETIIVVLLVLWLLGFFVIHIGSLIHVLLVLALIAVVVRLLRGRPAL